MRLPLLYSPAFEMPAVYDEIEYLYWTIELRDDRDTGVSDRVIHTSNLWTCPALILTEKEQREARRYLDLQLKSKGMSCEQLLEEERERMRRQQK